MARRRFDSRTAIKYGLDVGAAATAMLLALVLRTGSDFLLLPMPAVLRAVVVFTCIAGVVFLWRGMHWTVWRYVSLSDLLGIIVSVSIAAAAYAALEFAISGFEGLPRSAVFIAWGTAILLLGGLRTGYRMYCDQYLADITAYSRIPVLLVGDGRGAELFVRETQRDRGSPYWPVGILARRGQRAGFKIHGVEVLGTIDELDAALARLARHAVYPKHLVVTADSLIGSDLRPVLERAAAKGLSWRRIPRITELAEADGERLTMQPIAVEDLLDRPAATLDREAMARLVAGRRVLITGAGGSIGAELTRQVAAFGPARLTLLELSEHALYSIDQEIAAAHPGLGQTPVLADVRDRARLARLLRETRPELVFHAAALKHVPMVEDNPLEGVLTNVVGTRNMVEACRAAGVGTVVQISTDKVVHPSSVMGASKRLAEAYCQAMDVQQGGTRFVTVRFGNVLGSSGSVVPLFQAQLERGGPLTVTHPEATRFFMTIREAVELVLQASALGAESTSAAGKIFVLDMGKPVRIVDLAKQMIRLAGLRPGEDVEIAFTGLRRGEKLNETLLHDEESPLEPACPGLLLAAPRFADHRVLSRAVDELEQAARAGDRARTLELLRQAVPEYVPDPTLLDEVATETPPAAAGQTR
jgi:O-antigen biosynthesis protein WbqV